MAVHAPGDDDGSDPGMWARLMNYINPVGAAQAAPAPAASPAAAFQGPGTQSQSGGWPVNQAGQPQYAIPPTNQAMANPGSTNTPGILPFLAGGPGAQGGSIFPYANPNTAALANAASINTDLGGGSSGGGGASGAWPTPPIGGGAGNAMETPTGTPASASPPMPPPRPKVARQPVPVRQVAAAPAAVRPRARAPIVVPAARSPFTPVAAQNQDWSGGALSRYGQNQFGRQGTALDLSGLFRRG